LRPRASSSALGKKILLLTILQKCLGTWTPAMGIDNGNGKGY